MTNNRGFSYVTKTNFMLRDFKKYIEIGTSTVSEDKEYRLILKTLEQLEDNELQLIYIRYVKLFDLKLTKSGRTNVNGVPKADTIRKDLDLTHYQYNLLLQRTCEKVYNILDKLIKDEFFSEYYKQKEEHQLTLDKIFSEILSKKG